MKQLWIDDQKLIGAEIERLIQQKIPLFCLRPDRKETAKLLISGTTCQKNQTMLVLNHPHQPTCNKPTCLFYYHFANEPLRLFECHRVKKIDKYLGLILPKEIFEIQRRRYPRVPTPNNSMATFSFERKQRVYHATVEDVSAGGARLQTKIQDIIRKGTVITPLSLNLFQRFRIGEETRVIIPEATVKWSVVEGEFTSKMGLHFSLQGSSHETITNYVDLRSLEDALTHQ